METQIWHLPAPARGGLRKGMASVSPCAWEIASPPVVVLKPDNSIPPHMSLVPFELLPICGPFKGNAWDSRSPLSHSATKFTARSYGTSLLGTGTLGWETWCGAGILCFSGVTSAAEIYLLIFIYHT